MLMVMEPGVVPLDGVTVNHAALSVTVQLSAPLLLEIARVCGAGFGPFTVPLNVDGIGGLEEIVAAAA